MTGFRNVHNSGIIIGGNVENSAISADRTTAGATEDEVLDRIDDLVADLLKNARLLPPENRTVVRSEAAALQDELDAPQRDPARIKGKLAALQVAAAAVAPVAEIVKNITDLATHLIH
jgi:hypothetical protein